VLTDESVFVQQLPTTQRCLGFSRFSTQCNFLLCLNLIPRHKSAPFRSSHCIRIPFRTKDFYFGKRNLQCADPFISSFGCSKIFNSGYTGLLHDKCVPFKAPCCQLLLYLISTFKDKASWLGKSKSTFIQVVEDVCIGAHTSNNDVENG